MDGISPLDAGGPAAPAPQADRLRELVAKWRAAAAVKDSVHATMGIGWKACANELEAVLSAGAA